MNRPLVTPAQVEAFHADGVVLIRGVFTPWVDTIRAGIERSMHAPGQHAADYQEGGDGRFFNDFYCWPQVPEFFEALRLSPAAELAATLMRSTTSQLFHDHVLVKEPGTIMATPWHQDSAYYFLNGTQTVNLWIPVDPVDDATLRFVTGSHLWPKLVRPTMWQSVQDLRDGNDEYMAAPDIDGDPQRYPVLEWPVQPGDVLAFGFRTLHSAPGNLTRRRRRALSMRFVGDDVRYGRQTKITVPSFPNHRMTPGQRLREDWFPVMWDGQLTYASDARAAELQAIGTAAAQQVHAPPKRTSVSKVEKPRRHGVARWWSKLKKAARRIRPARGA